ncbi:MAG: zinc ribbon domain-containing protein [Candidatus Heimdallarchaeota archaeon]|nr:zinc ribbon domain-containing protein [Candidatus Heimdallarchaeota archaeon]
MMNLSDIKGIIEINGESYDPKSVLKALLDQGLKIHPLNGSLLIGRTFIDAAPNLQYGSTTCPISDHCKIYDKLYPQKLDETNPSEYSSNQSSPSVNATSDSSQTSSDRFYTDPIRIDIDDIDITNLFSDSTIGAQSVDDIEEDIFLNPDFGRELDSDPTEMVGLSPVTRYGRTSHIQESTVPSEYRGRCPFCNSIVNIKWKYCGSCGTSMS